MFEKIRAWGYPLRVAEGEELSVWDLPARVWGVGIRDAD